MATHISRTFDYKRVLFGVKMLQLQKVVIESNKMRDTMELLDFKPQLWESTKGAEVSEPPEDRIIVYKVKNRIYSDKQP